MARNETFTLEKNGTVRNGVDSMKKKEEKLIYSYLNLN